MLKPPVVKCRTEDLSRMLFEPIAYKTAGRPVLVSTESTIQESSGQSQF